MQSSSSLSQKKWSWQKRAAVAGVSVVGVVALILLPPYVNINRYQSHVGDLISTSLGRPVHLSGVELRLLPRPGFVVDNLSVDEDPAFGVEPILHATTVTANIGFLSLWRGKLSLGSIAMDEASLNLVRNGKGEWNLDRFLRGTSVKRDASAAQPAAKLVAQDLPTITATALRINLKREGEKLPFSLLDSKLTLDQSGNQWRLHLVGQPVRTDVALNVADTGELRVDARLLNVPGKALRAMPVHVEAAWRDAPLGQLSRLLTGTDAGWRGAMTAALVVDGSADSAQIKARLEAMGVHREEFAPALPLDFDANCTLHYQYSLRSTDQLLCDAPIGSGRARVSGTVAHAATALKIELDKLPAQAMLDTLRTMHSGVAEDLEAAGSISGAYDYARTGDDAPSLTGAMTVDGLVFKNGGLTEPLVAPKIDLKPDGESSRAAILADFALPMGAKSPLTFSVALDSESADALFSGSADSKRLASVARAFGIPVASVMGTAQDGLSAGTVDVRLAAYLPWIVSDKQQPELVGMMRFNDAAWSSPLVANSVKLPQTTVAFFPDRIEWTAPAFTYGDVHGAATVEIPAAKSEDDTEHARFHLHFTQLNAATLQAALSVPAQQGSGLTELFARLNPRHLLTATPDAQPEQNQLAGDVEADVLTVGPVTLKAAHAAVVLKREGAEIRSLDAKLLGGEAHLSGEVKAADNGPQYHVRGELAHLNSAEVGKLVNGRWSGGAINLHGELTLAGTDAAALRKSATGAFTFAWPHGAIAEDKLRFNAWQGDATVGAGRITLNGQPAKGAIALDAPRLTISR